MKKKVTLIKLGGSVITNKDIPMSLRKDVLSRLVEEIAEARKELPDTLFVVGHGQGSFGHVPAHQYKTMQGFINDESRYGMAVVQDTAAQLNRIVVHEFIRHDIPAVSLYPSNSLVTNNRVAENYCTDVFEEYIKQGLFPITSGDVIVDKKLGCTIWSAEEVLSFYAQQFADRGWQVEQIVHVTEVAGMLDHEKKLIYKVSEQNWPSLKTALTATKGFDVTGGMGLKIEESLRLVKKGILSKIISGLVEDNLYNTLTQKNWVGTQII